MSGTVRWRMTAARLVLVVVTAVIPWSARAGQQAVLFVESADALLDKLAYLMRETLPDGELPDTREWKDELAAGTFAGLDFDRPLGAFASLPAEEGDLPLAVVAIPITDREAALDMFRTFGATVEKERQVDGFTHRVSFTAFEGLPLFLVASRDYVFLTPLTTDPEALVRMKPEDWMPDRPDLGDVSLTVAIDEIPEPVVEQFLAQFESGLEADGKRQPGEPAMEYKGRLVGMRLVAEAVESLVRDAATLAVDVSVDRDAGTLALSGRLSARPGSPLAESLSGFDRLRSRFSGMASDAPLAAWMAMPIPEAIRDLFWEAFLEGATEELPKDPASQRLFNRMLTVVEGVVRQDVQDVGFAMLSPAGPDDQFSLAVAATIVGGDVIEETLREVTADADEELFEADAGRTKDGVSLHRLTGPVDASTRRIYGDASGWLGFRKDAVALGFGEGRAGRLAAERGLAAGAAGSESDFPIGAVVRVADLVPLVGLDLREADEVAEDAFAGANAEKDRLRLTVGGRRGDLRATLTVDVPTLRFFYLTGQTTEAAR